MSPPDEAVLDAGVEPNTPTSMGASDREGREPVVAETASPSVQIPEERLKEITTFDQIVDGLRAALEAKGG